MASIQPGLSALTQGQAPSLLSPSLPGLSLPNQLIQELWSWVSTSRQGECMAKRKEPESDQAIGCSSANCRDMAIFAHCCISNGGSQEGLNGWSFSRDPAPKEGGLSWGPSLSPLNVQDTLSLCLLGCCTHCCGRGTSCPRRQYARALQQCAPAESGRPSNGDVLRGSKFKVGSWVK